MDGVKEAEEFVINLEELDKLAEVAEVLGEIEERLERIDTRVKRRIRSVFERELVRLMRVKGLEIEDERAKTYFLCSIGYLCQLDYLKQRVEETLAKLRGTVFTSEKELLEVMRYMELYNLILDKIKKDNIFGRVVEEFGWFEYNWESEGIWKEYEIRSPDGFYFKQPPTVLLGSKDLIEILEKIKDFIELIILSIVGNFIRKVNFK